MVVVAVVVVVARLVLLPALVPTQLPSLRRIHFSATPLLAPVRLPVVVVLVVRQAGVQCCLAGQAAVCLRRAWTDFPPSRAAQVVVVATGRIERW